MQVVFCTSLLAGVLLNVPVGHHPYAASLVVLKGTSELRLSIEEAISTSDIMA